MFSNARYQIAIPAGIPAAIFVLSYTEGLRRKLVSILPAGVYEIRQNRVTKENQNHIITVRKGLLCGMKVVIATTKAALGQPAQIKVRVEADSSVQGVLDTLSIILCGILAIPAFILLVLVVRFIFLALLLTLIALAPIRILSLGLIAIFMSLVYSATGQNDFDEQRRMGIATFLQQMPLPDPMAQLAGARPNIFKTAPPGFY
jgi:hypothetical protein